MIFGQNMKILTSVIKNARKYMEHLKGSRLAQISASYYSIRGELQTVITFELRCFSPIPTFVLILVTSAFFWYLSWAGRVRVAPARAVTDTQTDRQTHTHTL